MITSLSLLWGSRELSLDLGKFEKCFTFYFHTLDSAICHRLSYKGGDFLVCKFFTNLDFPLHIAYGINGIDFHIVKYGCDKDKIFFLFGGQLFLAVCGFLAIVKKLDFVVTKGYDFGIVRKFGFDKFVILTLGCFLVCHNEHLSLKIFLSWGIGFPF